MSEAVLRVALSGNPNCGKTALFNALTGSRQKVSNYAGVTVERKEGFATTPGGIRAVFVDLPGTYSLDARSPDEEIARDVILGSRVGEPAPDAVVAVADATNLERSLGLVLEIQALGKPVVLALNMMDLALKRGLKLDLGAMEREIGAPVVSTVAIRGQGIQALLDALDHLGLRTKEGPRRTEWRAPTESEIRERFREVDRIIAACTRVAAGAATWTERIDRVLLHPVSGLAALGGLLLLIFQAVFSWSSMPADWIEARVGDLGTWAGGAIGEGPLADLVSNGIIAGVGSVLVFLPQILILFLFILLLEDSGYMARAAFLMDKVMGKVGLHGRAFIPLLSSYACAIPGIMAARTIESPRDRLATILVAPLTTCSARLPVYSLLIAAFIPERDVAWGIGLRGLVLFTLYAAGILSALAFAWALKLSLLRGKTPPFLLELPTYRIPGWRNLATGLLERARIFLRRAGTVILSLSVLIWFLSSYPKAPADANQPAIHYSYAGRFGHWIEPAIQPLGFDWRIGIALVPGFAAREVMVSALATVYAIEGKNDQGQADEEMTAEALGRELASSWSLATALSLLAWYVFALQCLSTVAVARRETNSWRWPIFMLVALTALAYAASFVTYHAARALGA